MTIAPMGPPLLAPGAAGATGAAPGSAPAGAPGAPGGSGAPDPALGFGALVAALVEDAGAGVPAQHAPADPADSSDSADLAESAQPSTDAGEVADQEDAEAAQCCTAMPPALLDLIVGRLPAPVPVPAPADPLTAPVADGTGPLLDGATVVEVATDGADPALTSPLAPTGPATAVAAADAVRRPEGAAPDAPAAVQQRADSAPAVQQRADSAPSVQQRADSAPDPGTATAADVTGSSATTTATPPATAAATATASADRPAAPPATAAVTRQVFAEVTRLASSGPGTHHLTLRLDPGSLGEVRVTLTVRAGQVRVSLAAGQEARDALLHSSPDLRRLLEQGGADATVTIRDLGAGGSTGLGGLLDRSTTRDDTAAAYARTAGEQVPSGSDRPAAGDPGPQRGPGHDHHARTREDTTARDGSPDPTTPSRPVELRTSRGPSGLDVSI